MEQEIHFCTTPDGVRIAYATVGEGPPLVKAANWLNHLEFDWRSPVWRHLLEEFAHNHLLVRYDERGNGLSDWAAEELSFESFVGDLESVVDALGLSRFSLLGISQGGAVAIAYAVRHPERVSHLILYGAYALGWAKRGAPAEEIERRQAQLTLTRLGWGQDNPAFRQLWTTLYMPDATPEQMQWFNDLQRVSTSPENAARLFRELGNIDVLDLLPQVKVPTLVLHCRSEAVAPFEEGRRIAALIPGARFVPLEGRNHLLLEGEPAWEKFITEVRRFLGTEQKAVARKQEGLWVAMKRCSTCQRVYADETLSFCRHDGMPLVRESPDASAPTVALADNMQQSREVEPTRAFHPGTASNEDSRSGTD
ncbi:MAG: alpha/beta hydrolase [Acidobacteria bacterium]|nr:alpha/beta hydrolase [Acidobacteriota bacterium]